MSLLYFADGGFANGVGSLFVEQVKAIHQQYKEVHAVVSSQELETGLIQSIEDENIPILYLHGLENHQHFKTHVQQLSDYIVKNKIDTVHVQSNWQLMLMAVVKYCLVLKNKLRILYTIHSYGNHKGILKATYTRIMIGTLLFLFADKIICTSSFVKKKFSLLNYKIFLLPLGLPDSFFKEYEACKTDSLRLIFPAQFRVGKNQDLLIEAFSEYVKETNDANARLLLPGGGVLLNQMKNLVQNIGLEKQILFSGQCTIEEVRQYYLDSNVALVASNSETFGYCITEPFALGRCIVTRHVGVADDIIQEGVNGYFFKDKNDFKKVLCEIRADMMQLQAMGEYNFRHRNQFNWHIITAQYLQEFICK
jgi:glycosyltransferase involved in cell wall biosynthesis